VFLEEGSRELLTLDPWNAQLQVLVAEPKRRLAGNPEPPPLCGTRVTMASTLSIGAGISAEIE
jgi:hypothetical protein